jgi:hypothetical protein
MFTPENFENANAGPYMKFQEGENRIRILNNPVTGYVYWLDKDGNVVEKNKMAGEGGKPIRAKNYDDFTMEQRTAMKGFASMVVWNYQAEKIQILEVKQIGIINSLEALSKSKSWGDVTTFDIIITKTKTGPNTTDVEYSVMPEPKEPLDNKISKLFKESNINLEALFTGDDPFKDIVDSTLDDIEVGDLDG